MWIDADVGLEWTACMGRLFFVFDGLGVVENGKGLTQMDTDFGGIVTDVGLGGEREIWAR